MTDMILRGDSYEKSCWKWSGMHSGTTIWMILGVILGVILRVRYVILMTDMILGGNSYEKSCWKWSGRHSVTTIWVWDMSMVILGVILGVILRVVYGILMTEMILGSDSYEKSCWKWSGRHSGTTN